jgi:hypothetical protein
MTRAALSSRLTPALATAMLSVALGASAQELLLQEGFNTDGTVANPPRYTTLGKDVWELSEIFGDPPLASAASQRGPIYFAHNFEVSFVGIPNIPARRMMFTWRGVNDTATTTEAFLELWDSCVAWLLENKPNAKVIVASAASSIGGLAARLESKGHTVLDDDTTKTDAQIEADGDLFIHAGGDASRFALMKKPVIVMVAPDWDDMIVGSIGTDGSFTPGQVNIGAPGHPAAGGKTGSFDAFTGDHAFALAGRFLPEGSTLLATVNVTVPPFVARLSDVDDMIAGTKQHDKTTGTLAPLDISDGSAGNWPYDLGLPGGYTGNWGLRLQGQLTVAAPGTYRFAMGTDDGARFQIDRDKNGFTQADTVIEDFGPHGHTIVYQNVTFAAAGTYDFEVRAYNTGNSPTFTSTGDFELSVGIVPAADIGDDALDSGYWETLGLDGAQSPVKLAAPATATGYIATGANTQTKEPLVVLMNGPNDNPPGAFYGGGPFSGFEGTGYFAGAGMNKFPFAEGDPAPPRTLTLRSVNVAGKKDVKLTVALAAAQIDFEADANDYLDINIYPNGPASTRITLAHFNGVESGRQPWLADDLDNNQRRLTKEFADFSYNIPATATDLIVEFVAGSSWWNEILAFDNVRVTAGAAGNTPITSFGAVRDGNNLKLTWQGGNPPFTVQKTATVNGQWATDQTTDERTATVPITGDTGFYRIKSQ